jgi:acetolactate synthase-1/2/3 large subunit
MSKTQLGGHLLVECLVAQGVKRVFGVPGESYLAVLDGFAQYAGEIELVVNRQEGGAAFMAEAAGKLSGRPGVCFVTRGPGATNASIGVHTAFQDSTPMVLFVGDVAKDARDREAFQEVDFAQMFGPLAKAVERIDDVHRIPEYVQRAFATAMNGRPGPVVVVLPEDMLTRETAAQALPKVEPVRPGLDAQALATITERLRAAQRPLLVVGGGGWTHAASQDLAGFAQAWDVPVTCAFRFQDLMGHHSRQYVGDLGLGVAPHLAQAVQDADVLLVLGARLGESTTGGFSLIPVGQPRPGLMHVHADARELNRIYTAESVACAGMPEALRALRATPAPEQAAWGAWRADLRERFEAHADPLRARRDLPGEVDMFAVMQQVRTQLPDDVVCTNGAGNFATWLHRFVPLRGWAVQGGRGQLAPTNGAMGYGVPAGVAAALETGRPVLTFTGDGDFLMNGQELATATAQGAKTVVVLINNGMYGTIRMHQEREYPGRTSGSGLANPDFVALAQAYGYGAVRVTQTDAFAEAWAQAWAAPGGFLIELVIDPEVITPRATLSDIRAAAMS